MLARCLSDQPIQFQFDGCASVLMTIVPACVGWHRGGSLRGSHLGDWCVRLSMGVCIRKILKPTSAPAEKTDSNNLREKHGGHPPCHARCSSPPRLNRAHQDLFSKNPPILVRVRSHHHLGFAQKRRLEECVGGGTIERLVVCQWDFPATSPCRRDMR